MPKTKTLYLCRECGTESLRWEGRCPACGDWNALIEAPAATAHVHAGSAWLGADAGGPRPITEATVETGTRVPLKFGDVDRVLGGGLVPGSVLLLGGAPGVGKSTLMLQVAEQVAGAGAGVLYASGEESAAQVGLRAQRLGVESPRVEVVSSADIDVVLRAARELEPALVCVDSIHTATNPRLASAPGSVSQVRDCAASFHVFSKRAGVAAALVGHVTKGGLLAGPRTLEHMVDVVLHFEGDRSGESRLLRSSKNRFGSAEEVAAFRMTPVGLQPVEDPSTLFLTDRPEGVSGSAVAVPLQGTRPLLAEVQALTCRARFASPQRICAGIPHRRLAILLAVLEKRGRLALADSDVFVSVVGGLRLADPTADLAVAAALISAEIGRPTPGSTAFIGEIGLGGELRGVGHVEARARTARRAGLTDVVVPVAARGDLADGPGVRYVAHVGELIELLRGA